MIEQKTQVFTSSPYRYDLVAEGGTDQFPDLDLSREDLTIRKYVLRSGELEKPLATLHIAARNTGDTGPVLLDWENQLAESLITLSPPCKEVSTLVTAVEGHLPDQALVLGWWDTSRRLALLSSADTLLRENRGRPLLLPKAWSGHRDAIEAFEQEFWNVPREDDAAADNKSFERLQAALLMDKVEGAAALRDLAGTRDAYLVLHVTDAYKLGALNSERFGIGYRDFPRAGNLHSTIGHIKK